MAQNEYMSGYMSGYKQKPWADVFYECPHCAKKFSKKSNMTRHTKLHSKRIFKHNRNDDGYDASSESENYTIDNKVLLLYLIALTI